MANQHLQEQFVALLTELTQAEDYDPTRILNYRYFVKRGMKTVEGALYEPSICLVAQGVKEVDYGDETLIYKPDNFLIASIDLPTSVTMYVHRRTSLILGLKNPSIP
ncbi:AraC family transcriptional regulator N-terminal domain-containing protein [Vibrio sp. PP-XX7]